MIEAAELELVRARRGGAWAGPVELDALGRQHPGRGGDDHVARRQRASRRGRLAPARRALGCRPASPAFRVPPGCLRRAWPAARRSPGGRTRRRRARSTCCKSCAEISREVAGAAVGTERELHRRAAIRRDPGQGARAIDVGLAARSLADRAVGAHHGGQKILKLALARVALADAHPLARWRPIDVQARCAWRAWSAD